MKVLTCTMLSVGTACTVAAQGKVEVAAVLPRPGDVATLDGMIRAYYEVISGPAGKARDWARDRTLYIKDLRFVQVDLGRDGRPAPRITDHQQYVDLVDLPLKAGFFETEIHRVTQRFGPIAHVWSTYECRQAEKGPVTARGINSIELFWDGNRWWIANAVWTDETKENPIPKSYLPRGK